MTATDQQQIDQLRIDLAQANIDLAEVRTQDFNSRQAKEKVHEGLRAIRDRLDRMGLCHSMAKRCANGGA